MDFVKEIAKSDDGLISMMTAFASSDERIGLFLLNDSKNLSDVVIDQVAGLPILSFLWNDDNIAPTILDFINFSDNELPEPHKLNENKVIGLLESMKLPENKGRFITKGASFTRNKKIYSFSITGTYLCEKKQFLLLISHLPEFDNLQSFLLDVAEMDEATGLFGRKALKYDLHEAKYDGKSFFLFMDIDHFKKLNDENGHLFGDEVLKVFGDALNSVNDPRWKAYRYGGDEFAVIVQCEELEEVKLLVWKVKHYVDAHLDPKYNVFFSTGAVRMYPFIHETLDLVKCADRAMYKAKKSTKHFHCTSEDTARTISL
ncbi:MAG: GGDEF domain-containing protein [Bacilli bacterium]|nr:GGDEF domain-containing protein [Bacilli bacterium]